MYAIYKRINNAILKNESIFTTVFLLTKRRILFRIKDLYLQIILIEGIEKHSNKKIKVLFCGDNYSFQYVSNILFQEILETQYNKKKYFILRLSKKLNYLSKRADVTIIKTDRFFSRYLQKKGFIIIPSWVNLKLDISKPLEDIVKNFKKSAKEDVNKVKKFNYTYKLTKSEKEFDQFYNEIRNPYFSKRVGDQAIPGTTSYFELKNAFKKGSLLLVKDGKQTISGFVVIQYKHSASPHFMGIKMENKLYKTAGSALFYFFIKWAKEKDIPLLIFGLTRPFLNDGPFRFKRKWGMAASIDKRFFDMFAIKINNSCNEATESFFENNPFFYIKDNKLYGFIYLQSTLSIEDQKKLLKRYYIDGPSDFNVIQTKEQLESFFKNVYN